MSILNLNYEGKKISFDLGGKKGKSLDDLIELLFGELKIDKIIVTNHKGTYTTKRQVYLALNLVKLLRNPKIVLEDGGSRSGDLISPCYND